MATPQLKPETIGLAAGVLSAAAFSVMALFVRMARSDFSTGQLLFARGLAGILLFSWLCRHELRELFKFNARHLWLRAMFGGGSVACYFLNLRDMSLGTATVLTDLAPVFVALFSVLYLNEKPYWKTIAGVLISFCGVFILSSSTTLVASIAGVAIGVAGAIFGAFAYLSLKRASQNFRPFLVVLTFSLAILGVSFIDRSPIFEVRHGADFWPVIGAVVASVAAQVLLTVSYKFLSATTAATLGLTAVLWALLFDAVLVGLKLASLEIAAIALILFGVLLTRAKRASQP
jgi:drug/metabolite transporter (DMT)-like permease